MSKKNVLFYLINITIPMILGLLIYLFSSDDTLVSDFFNYFMGLSFPPLNKFIMFRFARNYLCDAFWAYALFFSLCFFCKNKASSFAISAVSCIAFEFLQKLGVVSGTFDILDILFELIAVIASASIIHLFTRRNDYEKHF